MLGTFFGVDSPGRLFRFRKHVAPCSLARLRLRAWEKDFEDSFGALSVSESRMADIVRERMLWYVSAGMWNQRLFRVVLSAENLEYVDLQLDKAGYPLRGLYHVEILCEPFEYSLGQESALFQFVWECYLDFAR